MPLVSLHALLYVMPRELTQPVLLLYYFAPSSHSVSLFNLILVFGIDLNGLVNEWNEKTVSLYLTNTIISPLVFSRPFLIHYCYGMCRLKSPVIPRMKLLANLS